MKVIQEKVLRHPKIEVRFNAAVVRLDGAGGKLKAVTIRDRQTGETKVIHPAGVVHTPSAVRIGRNRLHDIILHRGQSFCQEGSHAATGAPEPVRGRLR